MVARPPRDFTNIVCSDTDETFETYDGYIKTAHWQYFRRQAINLSDGVCDSCGKPHGRGAVVHHLHYESLGDERFDDVQVLCKSCHNGMHVKSRHLEAMLDGFRAPDFGIVDFDHHTIPGRKLA